MPMEITVPKLGWSMEEAIFVGWLKSDGEPVKTGDPLFTLETEKASQDIEATDTGILRISPDSPQPGMTVQVGQVMGHLVAEGEIFTSGGVPPQPLSAPPEREPKVSPEEASIALTAGSSQAPNDALASTSTLEISPRARRRAVELGVDRSRLKGSGRGGRVTEADVLEAAKTARASNLSIMRRTIAQRTAESFASVPHFYLRFEVDATMLLQLREQLLPEIERATAVRLTLTDLLLRAQALALRDCPFANAIWQEDNIVHLPACDVGLVVGLTDGLLIPIVRSADGGDLAALAKQRASLVEMARAGKLTAEALEGGATSLSNLGNTRVDEFAAVLPPLHSSILAVGRAARRAFAAEGSIGERMTLKLCLSVDHRVMDGGPASEFIGRIAERLEKPLQLLEGK